MDAVHDALANLFAVRVRNGYRYAPLSHLGRRWKRNPKGVEILGNYLGPTTKKTFKALSALAHTAGYDALGATLSRLFNDRVRNAFAHSDYVLTDHYFRFREGGVAQQITLDELDGLIAECFAFYAEFVRLHRQWLQDLARGKRFRKCPNYEVLELLSSEEEGVFGFSLHFSNGSKSTWMRRKGSGTVGSENISVGPEGIVLEMGPAPLELVWKIDGKAVKDWEALP
jgi:hypothetical protein